ncbi:phosphotransferase enzyme family protein [Gluconobacter kanchanaburiensis]|uniref:Aminoglycoside phosphotransferase n=1 Tax=Gluconobacter kanchanaburiensis NBRC 103587 TaxID=1307948 RepID=A0A511B969_9PROT|nr:phosphotransferase [Gluconobacter kanchanaburiensis]MBF0862652.1 phosphotransferase [Gluconobacter kanchanaburiensis]GBR67553.1 aminoglycoside phosphotransferase [Gluconobacter kanchanaburiensis NBRC 103587]GEK96976.1 aminoglycoside phosphotransferase [Gluconobacter kanchanaburiensis NBRC 103587]
MAEASGQFGVNGLENRRDWPALADPEVRRVLSHFPLPAPARQVVWHGRRPFSSTGVVSLENGSRVFVKRHDHCLRNATALAEEHRFIAHLSGRGIPVGQTWRTTDGQAALDFNGSAYEVFSIMPGHDLYETVQSWEPFHNIRHAFSAGLHLGQLHEAARSFDAPARPSSRPLLSTFEVITSPDLMAGLNCWIPQQSGLAEALTRHFWRKDIPAALLKFHERLKPHLSEIQPRWGHGDWHPSNLFWDDTGPDAQICGILDFGMSDQTCAAYDLAVAIERSAIEWLRPENDCPVAFDRLDAFLRGYQTRYTISDTERSLVSLFLPLVHVEYALSEVAYYETLVHDQNGVKAAYTDYLLGHAHWFSSPSGQKMLDWLEQTLKTSACP